MRVTTTVEIEWTMISRWLFSKDEIVAEKIVYEIKSGQILFIIDGGLSSQSSFLAGEDGDKHFSE